MANLRVLIIEDNPIHALNAQMLLEELGYQLAGIANNTREAISLFMATKPDIVLMDIDLSTDDTDGIEIAQKINTINPVPIIFVTAFTDKKTFERAKATEPYAYLIKPLEKESLERNVELAVFNFAKSYMRQGLENDYFSGWTQNLMTQDSFFVKTSNALEKVRYQEVLWIEVSSDRYCEIKTQERSFTVRASLKNLAEKLSPYRFIRVHRTYIVNTLFISSISELDMTINIEGHTIPIGSSYKKAVLDQLNIL